MAAIETDNSEQTRPQPVFATTRWSVVLAAGHGDTTHAQDALAHLCQTYWYPLYAYARRRGHSPPDAQDLTQEFFTRLLRGNWVAKADQQRGRFRTFLLSAMQHFMANEWNRAHAQKRAAPIPSSHSTTIPPSGVTSWNPWKKAPRSRCSNEAGPCPC